MRVPWTARRLNQSILKEINPEYSLERLKLKLKLFWPHDVKSQLIGKDPDAEKDWGQDGKRVTEDEMDSQDQRCNGHEVEQTPGDSGGERSLVCCLPWDSRARHDLVNKQQQHDS